MVSTNKSQGDDLTVLIGKFNGVSIHMFKYDHASVQATRIIQGFPCSMGTQDEKSLTQAPEMRVSPAMSSLPSNS
jgi:hypothetical protein